MGRRVLKFDGPLAGGFLSLTAFQAEGGGGGFAIGHAFGVRVHRVQKVQKVQKVQRVVVAADATNFIMPPLAALSTHKRQVIWQRSSPPCYLPTPFPGVGGERSETEGGGWMGHSVARGSKGSEGSKV